MNDIMTQMNLLIPSMGSPTMGPGVSVPSTSSEASVFGNLLDIVSDMQVADAQGFEQSDFLSERSEQLFDPELRTLDLAARQVNPLVMAQPQLQLQQLQPKTDVAASIGQRISTPPVKGASIPVEMPAQQ